MITTGVVAKGLSNAMHQSEHTKHLWKHSDVSGEADTGPPSKPVHQMSAPDLVTFI